MSKNVKTIGLRCNGIEPAAMSSPIQNDFWVSSFVVKRHLYRMLWRIPMVKWNSLQRVVLNLTGRGDQAVKFCFYFRVVGFTHRSQHPEVDNIIRHIERNFRGSFYSPRPTASVTPDGQGE